MKSRVIQAIAKAGIDVLDKDLIKIIKENIDSGLSPQDSFTAAHKLLEVPVHKNTASLIDVLRKLNPNNESYDQLLVKARPDAISRFSNARKEIGMEFKRAKRHMQAYPNDKEFAKRRADFYIEQIKDEGKARNSYKGMVDILSELFGK